MLRRVERALTCTVQPFAAQGRDGRGASKYPALGKTLLKTVFSLGLRRAAEGGTRTVCSTRSRHGLAPECKRMDLYGRFGLPNHGDRRTGLHLQPVSTSR